jgi:CRP-like cAMP-binding protein
LEQSTFQPGSNILQQGQHVEYFYMIVSGAVDVILGGNEQKDLTIARLEPGQFFGEVELMRGGKSIACIRAASQGMVELAALPREPFIKLLSESTLTEEALGKLVQIRVEENASADQRGRKR